MKSGMKAKMLVRVIGFVVALTGVHLYRVLPEWWYLLVTVPIIIFGFGIYFEYFEKR